METYLSKTLEQKKFKIRLLATAPKDKPIKALLLITDPKDEKQVKTVKPFTFNNFNFKQIKEKIKQSLNDTYISLDLNILEGLLQDIENKINNNVYYEDTLNQPGNNTDNLKEIVNYSLGLITPNNINRVKGNSKTSLELIEEFLTTVYKEELITSKERISEQNNRTSLIIDYTDLETFNPDLADLLIDNPQEIIQSFNKCIGHLSNDLKNNVNYNFEIYARFKNINPPYKFRDVKSNKIAKFIEIKGNIKTIGEVRPSLDMGVFECKGCLKHHSVKQKPEHNGIIEPSLCSDCGGRTFRLLPSQSVYYDTQLLTIEEELDEARGKPKSHKVIVSNDLTDKAIAGDKIKLTGILTSEFNPQNNKTNFLILANNIELLDEQKEIILTNEDIREIKKAPTKNYIEGFLNYMANLLTQNENGQDIIILPNEIKLSLLCYLVDSNPIQYRDWLNILIIGDPATAKTQIKRIVKNYSHKCILASGLGTTTRGLTSTIVNINGENVLQAGAYPMANGGHIIIDEFDKIKPEDQAELNEALNDGVINVDKGGISTTLKARAGALCFGNPKYKRFDNYKHKKDQINIHEDVLSRFDLIFIIIDETNTEKDFKIANAIINNSSTKDLYINPFLKKYLAYARGLEPIFSKENEEYIINCYVELRGTNLDEDNTIIINARHLESLERLSSSIAKLNLHTAVTTGDIDEAIKILNYSLHLMGQEEINPDPKRMDRKIILKLLKDHTSLTNGINKKELETQFINETGKSKDTFRLRFNDLVNSNVIIFHKKSFTVYLNKDKL